MICNTWPSNKFFLLNYLFISFSSQLIHLILRIIMYDMNSHQLLDAFTLWSCLLLLEIAFLLIIVTITFIVLFDQRIIDKIM